MIDRVEHWIDISNKWRERTSTKGATAQSMCNGSANLSQTGSEQIPHENSSSGSEQLSSFREVLAGETIQEPEFPLLPASKGFCITVRKHLDIFKETLVTHIHNKAQIDEQ